MGSSVSKTSMARHVMPPASERHPAASVVSPPQSMAPLPPPHSMAPLPPPHSMAQPRPPPPQQSTATPPTPSQATSQGGEHHGEEGKGIKNKTEEETVPPEFEYRITENYHHSDPSVRPSDEHIRAEVQEKIDIYSFEAGTPTFFHSHPMLLPPTRVTYFFEHHPRLDRNVTIPPQSRGVSGALLQHQDADTMRDLLAEMAFEENEAYDSLCDEASVRLEVYEAFVHYVEQLAAAAAENPSAEGMPPPQSHHRHHQHVNPADAATAQRLVHGGFLHIPAFQDKDMPLAKHHHHHQDYSHYVHSKSPFQLQQWIHDMETQLTHLPWTPQDLKFQLDFFVRSISHFHDTTHDSPPHAAALQKSSPYGKHGATPLDSALQTELSRFHAGELNQNVPALHRLRFHCFEAYAHIRGDRRRRALFHLNTWRHMHHSHHDHHHYDDAAAAPGESHHHHHHHAAFVTSDDNLNHIVQMELEPYLYLHYEKDIREYLSSHASHQMGYWTELLELYHRTLLRDYFHRFDPQHVHTTTVMSHHNVERLFTDYIRNTFAVPANHHCCLNAFELNQLMRWCWHLEKALAHYQVPVAAYNGPPTPYKEPASSSSSPEVTRTLYHEHGTYDEYPHELENDSGIALRC